MKNLRYGQAPAAVALVTVSVSVYICVYLMPEIVAVR